MDRSQSGFTNRGRFTWGMGGRPGTTLPAFVERHRAPHPHRRPLDTPGRPPSAPGARPGARRRRVKRRQGRPVHVQGYQGHHRVAGRVSGHSLRVGSAQSLAAAGAGLVELQEAGDWQAPTMPAHTVSVRPAAARRPPPPHHRANLGGVDVAPNGRRAGSVFGWRGGPRA